MKSPRLPVAAIALAFCLSPVLTPTAHAQSVPLGHGVGKDAHLVVHGVTSQTPDPSLVAFDKALAHLAASGIHEDILDLATMDLREQDAEEARAIFHHVMSLLGLVDWAELMGQEVVFAERLVMPMPEYLLICRVPEDRAAEHLAGMRAMFNGFAQMIGEAAGVKDVERRTGNMVVLGIQGAPVQLAAGHVGDAMVLSTSTRSTAAAMRRLAGDGKGSLSQDERFQETMKQLPPGTESTFYLDVDGLMGFFGQMMQLASGGVGDDPKAAAMVGLCRALIEELDVVDHLAVSTASDGTTTTETTLVRMKPDFEDSRLIQLCAKQQPWTDWHRYVPVNATSFVFDAGIDVGGTIDWLTELAVETAGGPDQAPWARHPMVSHLREILGHLSGESACVTFPRAGEAGCALGETVVMLRLEKTEGVSNWLRAHLDHLAQYAVSRGQEIEISSRGEMHIVAIEAFPWIHPVIGVHDGMIVLASSPAALEQIALVHRGEAKDIRASERFAQLGIGNGGHYLDYYQFDASMEGFNNLVSAAGFFLSMLPEDRDTREAIKVGAILTKLAPALRELDLSMDIGSEMLESPSPDVYLTRRVTRYRR